MLFSTLTTVFACVAVVSARSTPRRADLEARDAALQKRAFSGKATFYDVGLGSCGDYNVESDFIVALNAPQMGGGYPQGPCGSQITISYGGKTATATIKDTCPGCAYGSLDMSRSLFSYFASQDLGTFQMSWWFNDGSEQQAPAPAPAAETKTSTWVAPTSTWVAPTSTWVAPTSTWVAPTGTWVAPAAPTSVWAAPSQAAVVEQSSAAASSLSASLAASSSPATASSAGISASSSASSPAASASSAVGTTSGTLAVGDNIHMINELVATLGHIVVVGAGGDLE